MIIVSDYPIITVRLCSLQLSSLDRLNGREGVIHLGLIEAILREVGSSNLYQYIIVGRVSNPTRQLVQFSHPIMHFVSNYEFI